MIMKRSHLKAQQGYSQMIKFIIIGDFNVGKTSFLNRFCYGTYKNNIQCTVGLQCGQKVYKILQKKILVQIWDTAGQQKFRSLTPSFYRSAMGIILMFSVDNRQSFNSIAVWMKQISSFAVQDIPLILVANKADLTKKQVSQKQCQKLANAYKVQLMIVSCKQNINIEQTVRVMYKMIKNEKENLKDEKQERIKMKEQEKKHSCFC